MTYEWKKQTDINLIESHDDIMKKLPPVLIDVVYSYRVCIDTLPKIPVEISDLDISTINRDQSIELCRYDQYTHVIKYVISSGYSINHMCLHTAILYNAIKIASVLLEGINVMPYHITTAIQVVPDHKSCEMLQLLLNCELKSINDKLGTTTRVINKAILVEHLSTAIQMRELDDNIELRRNLVKLLAIKSAIAVTTITQAVTCGDLKILEMILDTITLHVSPYNALYAAIYNGRLDMVKALITKGCQIHRSHVELAQERSRWDIYTYLTDGKKL